MNLPITETQFFKAIKYVLLAGGIILETLMISWAWYSSSYTFVERIEITIALGILDVSIIGIIGLITEKDYLRIHFKPEYRKTFETKGNAT